MYNGDMSSTQHGETKMIETIPVALGVWRVTVYGMEYLVTVTSVSNYKGGSLSGRYEACFNGYKSNGDGCFLFSDIEKMEKVS